MNDYHVPYLTQAVYDTSTKQVVTTGLSSYPPQFAYVDPSNLKLVKNVSYSNGGNYAIYVNATAPFYYYPCQSDPWALCRVNPYAPQSQSVITTFPNMDMPIFIGADQASGQIYVWITPLSNGSKYHYYAVDTKTYKILRTRSIVDGTQKNYECFPNDRHGVYDLASDSFYLYGNSNQPSISRLNLKTGQCDFFAKPGCTLQSPIFTVDSAKSRLYLIEDSCIYTFDAKAKIGRTTMIKKFNAITVQGAVVVPGK